MVDEISRQLPVVQNSVSPPFWGRALLNAVSEVGEGELVLRFSNGAERTIRAAKSGASAVLNIARARTLRRLVFGGTVGLAESYLDGDWESPDLASVFEFGARNMDRMIGGLRGLSLLRLPRILKHKARANTRKGSRRNIAAHYDLGNTFYSQWLDPTMTYSSALFESKDMSLEDAQRTKWRRMAETLDLKPGRAGRPGWDVALAGPPAGAGGHGLRPCAMPARRPSYPSPCAAPGIKDNPTPGMSSPGTATLTADPGRTRGCARLAPAELTRLFRLAGLIGLPDTSRYSLPRLKRIRLDGTAITR